MRKRVASINEAPITERERRIAAPRAPRNTWLADQGVGGPAFPPLGGSLPCYPGVQGAGGGR